MRCESADFIGARSGSIGCNKAGYTAATHPVDVGTHETPAQTGRVHIQPGVRQTSQHHKLSITTVIHAYLLLESKGIIESRPQSGYFVRLTPDGAGSKAANELLTSKPIAVSAHVDVSRLVLSTLRSIGAESATPLGSPYPDPKLFPFDKINRYAYNITRRKTQWGVTDELPPGNPQLIRQIAR